MGKVEKVLDIAELALIAFLVWFIITKAEEYGGKLGELLKGLKPPKLPKVKPWEWAKDFARKKDEIRFYEASLPRNVVEQIKEYTEKAGLPEGAYLAMLKQARRYYEWEKKLKGYSEHKGLEALTWIREKGMMWYPMR